MVDDKEKQTRKLKIAVEGIPEEDREKLLSFDDAFVFAKGYHLISDYQKLTKKIDANNKDIDDFKLLSKIVVDPHNKINDVPYPTMFNYPDDLTEYSFTPYLKYAGNGWYEVDDSAPDYVKRDYEKYFLNQKKIFRDKVIQKKQIKKSVHDLVQSFREKGCKTIDDVHAFKEYPFVYDGMSLDEYEKELIYYYRHTIEEIHSGKYVPLWKQERDQINLDTSQNEFDKLKEEYLKRFDIIPVEICKYPKEELTKIFRDCIKNNKDAIEMGYYEYDEEFYL